MRRIPAAAIYFPEEDKRTILDRVEEILGTGQLTLGKYTREFEEQFARYVGATYAVAVNSGTAALEIILRALEAARASIVVPTNTFYATAGAVLHAGGEVIFADVDSSLCLDVQSLERHLRADTKGVVVVHIGGNIAPQIEDIQRFCRSHGLFLVEDAAHAHGSMWKAKRAGRFGVAAAFSFYPTKVMTSAEGGMIVTDREEIYQKALVLRDQGKAAFGSNFHTELGYNWRMSEIHAVIGLSQLQRLDEFIRERRRVARIYDEGLSQFEAVVPLLEGVHGSSNYYKYIACLAPEFDRSLLKQVLREQFGVSLSGEVYELPCHQQPVFQRLYGDQAGRYPVSEELCQRHICLPVSAVMTEDDAQYVVESLRGALR